MTFSVWHSYLFSQLIF